MPELKNIALPATLLFLLLAMIVVFHEDGLTEHTIRQMIHLTAASSMTLFSLTFSASSLHHFLSRGRWQPVMQARRRLAALVCAVGLATATPLTLAQHAPGQVECQAKARQLKGTLDLDFQQREKQIATERNNAIQRCGMDTNCRNAASAKAVQLTLDNKAQFNKATSQAQAQLMQCNQIAEKPIELVSQQAQPDETFSSNDQTVPGVPATPSTSGRPAPLQGGVTDENRKLPPRVYKAVDGEYTYDTGPQSASLSGGTATGSAPGSAAAQPTPLPLMTGETLYKDYPIIVTVGGGSEPEYAGGFHNGDPRRSRPDSPFSFIEGQIISQNKFRITAVTWASSGKRDTFTLIVKMNCVNKNCK